jgi:hypothetical protein
VCSKHLRLAQNKPLKSDILKDFPEGVVERTKFILTQVTNALVIVETFCVYYIKRPSLLDGKLLQFDLSRVLSSRVGKKYIMFGKCQLCHIDFYRLETSALSRKEY